jgi:hypothetical protein
MQHRRGGFLGGCPAQEGLVQEPGEFGFLGSADSGPYCRGQNFRSASARLPSAAGPASRLRASTLRFQIIACPVISAQRG